MTLQIAQFAERRPQQSWWDWAVWIEGPKEELDRVREVEYRLHASFADPLRRISSRENKFRLESSGWGEFLIRAQLTLTDGETVDLEHWLQLAGDETRAPGKPATVPPGLSVFLSSSAIDTDIVRRLAFRLRERGIAAFQPDDLRPGEPWQQVLERKLQNATMMVVFAPERSSPWLEREFDIFGATGRPVLLVNSFGPSVPIPSNIKVQALQIKPGENPDMVADQVANRVTSMINDYVKR